MNIVNLVGKLSFDTDLKGAEKFLAISKKCNEEAKQLQKNLKKAGEDEMFVGLGERAKKIKEELKNIKAQGYASPRTLILQNYIKDLKERKDQLLKDFRSIGLSYTKKINEYAESGDKAGLRGARLAKARQYLTYRTRRATLDDKIAGVQERLKASREEDKETLGEILGKKQAGADVLTKARDERKKEIIEENKLTKEKIDNLKTEGAKNKDFAKESQKAHKGNLLALGKFAMAVGIATTVLKGVESIYRNTMNTTTGYMNATAGSNVAPEKLEGMATNLAGLGVGIDKKTLAPILGKANWKAGTRRFGQNMNAQNLAMAGVDPSQALSVESLINNLYKSYYNGTDDELIANALATENLPVGNFMTAFKKAKRGKISPEKFADKLGRDRMGATEGAKDALIGIGGFLKETKQRATGVAGMMWSDFWGKGINPLESAGLYYARQQGQGGNISINKNITVNTDNGEAVKNAINDEVTEYKIMQVSSGGGN